MVHVCRLAGANVPTVVTVTQSRCKCEWALRTLFANRGQTGPPLAWLHTRADTSLPFPSLTVLIRRSRWPPALLEGSKRRHVWPAVILFTRCRCTISELRRRRAPPALCSPAAGEFESRPRCCLPVVFDFALHPWIFHYSRSFQSISYTYCVLYMCVWCWLWREADAASTIFVQHTNLHTKSTVSTVQSLFYWIIYGSKYVRAYLWMCVCFFMYKSQLDCLLWRCVPLNRIYAFIFFCRLVYMRVLYILMFVWCVSTESINQCFGNFFKVGCMFMLFCVHYSYIEEMQMVVNNWWF